MTHYNFVSGEDPHHVCPGIQETDSCGWWGLDSILFYMDCGIATFASIVVNLAIKDMNFFILIQGVLPW